MTMKKIVIFALLLVPCFVVAQAITYADMGILFSRSYNKGSARYQALSNSMQAIGADVSASIENPAGLAVRNQGAIGLTFINLSNDTETDYYGTKMSNEDNRTTIQNAYWSFVRPVYESDWKKIGWTIYYQKNALFHNAHWTSGNNTDKFATFTKYPNDATQYTVAQEQKIHERRMGYARDLGLLLAGQYGEHFYFGLRISSNAIFFNQNIQLREKNTDTGGNNTLNATLTQRLEQTLSGFSFGIGLIYKPFHQFRIGLSYQSPVWYDAFENSNIVASNENGYLHLKSSKFDTDFLGNDDKQEFNYRMTTPSTATISLGFVLGKRGFVNADYQVMNYRKIRLNSDTDDFITSRKYFADELKSWTANFGAGLEIREKALSFRGGFRYYQLPYKTKLADETDPWQWSLGVGYAYRNLRLDLALVMRTSSSVYDYYNQYQEINAVTMNNTQQHIVTGVKFLFD